MISHHHRCVFVHIPKCGGMSVEHIFLADLGLAWEERAPLLLRPRVDGEAAPPRLAHLTARQYVANRYIPESMFLDYLTFAVVRDPFTRTASLYRYLALDLIMSFERFVTAYLPEVLGDPDHEWYWFLRPQAHFITGDDGETAVDAVVKLENIGAELPPVLARVGLHLDVVPHVNKVAALRRRRQARLWMTYALGQRELPSLPLRRHQPVWSERLRASLGDLYHEDFRLLDYVA